MKKYFNLMGRPVLAFALSFFFLHCGGATSSTESDDTTDIPQLTTIDELPQATGPVEADASANISALKSKSIIKAATTGMNLRDVDESFFTADSSTAACEMYNMTKNAIQNAAQGDLILCYVQQIFTAAQEAGLNDAEGQPIDIYDGQAHVFAMDFTGVQMGDENISADQSEGDHGPDHVKFTINKSGQVIAGFEMHACSSGTQNEYLNQTISGNSFTMRSKHFESNEGNEFANDTQVSGTLNAEGKFVGSKTIAMNFTGTMSDETSQYGVYNFVQGSDSATMTGYMNGTFIDPFNDVTGSFTNQVVGSMEMLDPNTDGSTYDIGLLALGDGAVYGAWSGSVGEQTHTDDFTEGWNGDSGAVDAEIAAAFISDVEGSTLPDEEAPTIAFGDDETYDCGDTVEATIVVADINVNMTECSNLQLSHDWINCWQIVQEGQGGGNDDQQQEGEGDQQQGGGSACSAPSDCQAILTGYGDVPADIIAAASCDSGHCAINCLEADAPSTCVSFVEGEGSICTDSICSF